MTPDIVHITCDFPDAVQPRKTRAVAALIEGTSDEFAHRVYSLNRVATIGRGRTAPPGHVVPVADDGTVASWTYAAPSRGLFLATAMRRVADRILDEIARSGRRPALIHGHKLSVEGLAVHRVARSLGVPYVLSLQGNTDKKVLKVRRDLRARYAAVYRDAARVFAFSPWIADWCSARLGPPARPPIPLPCILSRDDVLPPVMRPPLVATAFHLEHYKLKNVERLIGASVAAANRVPGLALDIGGGGPGTAEAAVDELIRSAGGNGVARRIGPVAPASIQCWMNQAAVFALPSLSESFGMVLVEALLAGCPIVYPEGRAVSGYFDGCGFALAVPPRDTAAIADALVELLRDQERRKTELLAWQQSPASAAFRRDAILDTYRAGLRAALAVTFP